MAPLFHREASAKCIVSPTLEGKKKQKICIFILIQYVNTLDMTYRNLVHGWTLKFKLFASIRVNQNSTRDS